MLECIFLNEKKVKIISKNLYGLKQELKNRGVVGHHFVGRGVGQGAKKRQ